MPVTGKMTVDLYANPDPFVQGMKAAENAAKKSGHGIAASIEKINAKQMKNLGHEILGGLGVIGMADAGAKMALEMIKGFKDGSEKGLSGAMETKVTLTEGMKEGIRMKRSTPMAENIEVATKSIDIPEKQTD